MNRLIEAVNALGKITFLDWAPLILSVIATWAAIYVPSKIAKKQNKIAVFDKLYTAYGKLLMVESFAHAISDYGFDKEDGALSDRYNYFINFKTNFEYYPDIMDEETSIGEAMAALSRNEIQAYMIAMLISKNEKQKRECSKMISAIYEPLFQLTKQVIMFEECEVEHVMEVKREFVKNTRDFFDRYARDIEKKLLCGK